ncbi:hypothetical protein FE525_18855, partial [Clostridioides difficile]|nr:hypothetical protein [Clostridioides difficile]
MGYLHILILSMVPVTELRGAIPIGIACSLSINGLKLDKSLLKETFNREKVYSIIQCIIEMSHRIGMSV